MATTFCGRHRFLPEVEVEPAAKLKAGLANGAAVRESKFFVKRDAGYVCGINATNQRVQTGSGGLSQNRVEQRLANALAAKTVVDVDRVFGRKAIRREWAKWPPCRKAGQNARFLHDTQHW